MKLIFTNKPACKINLNSELMMEFRLKFEKKNQTMSDSYHEDDIGMPGDADEVRAILADKRRGLPSVG